MNFRTANINDIPSIWDIRLAVKENQLSDPNSIPISDIEQCLLDYGNGWVCEIDNRTIGFSLVDLRKNYVWALFVHPNFEKQGVGKELLRLLLGWYFEQTDKTIWLSTGPGTRAEQFYIRQGWIQNGLYGDNEIKFEMTKEEWESKFDK